MAKRFSIAVTEQSMKIEEIILTHDGNEKPFIPKAYAVRAVKHIKSQIMMRQMPQKDQQELFQICDFCIGKLLALGGDEK